MKDVLIIALSPVHRDPRVRRQIEALLGHGRVALAAYTKPPAVDVEFFLVNSSRLPWYVRALRGVLKLAGAHVAAYWLDPDHRRLVAQFSARKFDVVIANDVETLPIALRVRAGRVVLDAHEYAPRQFEHDWRWRMVSGRHAAALLRRYAGRADAMLTVSSGLAAAYRNEYGLAAEVMPNATRFHEVEPAPVEPGRIRLVHHGIASPARHIEDMLVMMQHLDERFSLDLYLMPGPAAYMRRLEDAAARDSRIRLRLPVPMDEIVPTVNRYDVGIAYFRPATFNLANTLPNKFFEYVQARVAVATGPTPDIAELVTRYGIGVQAAAFTPEALAAALSKLDDCSLSALKAATALAARELSFENYAARFRQVVLGGGVS